MQNLNPFEAATALLSNKIIELSPAKPFTFASGIKSPIYCDSRLVISNPSLRADIAFSLAQKIKTQFPDVEVISGVATGSIALAAWISDILKLPMIYYRKPKGYGHNNTIEGQFTNNQKVVVVEDVVSTGGSCLTAVDSLRESGLDVLGVAFIYSHMLTSSVENFKSKNCQFINLCGLDDVVESAKNSNIITPDQVGIIQDWHLDPANWGAKNGF